VKFEAKGRERGRGSWKGGSKLEGLGSTVHVLQCSAFCFIALVALCQSGYRFWHIKCRCILDALKAQKTPLVAANIV